MKTICKRLVADPVFVIRLIAKKFFWQYVLFVIGLSIGITIGAMRVNQNIVEAILISLIMYFAIPILVIASLVAIHGRETFLYEVEDVIHVVRPNFSFQKKND